MILRTGKIENVNKLRPYDKIHRISTRQQGSLTIQIACAAGREVLFGSIVDNEFQVCFLTKFNDWISSVKVLSCGQVAILTAHGFLALVQVDQGQARILKKVQSGENSTLYCSMIYGDAWENLTVLCGTALGELVVWRAEDGKVLNRLFLHNGVIFCIDFDGVNLVS